MKQTILLIAICFGACKIATSQTCLAGVYESSGSLAKNMLFLYPDGCFTYLYRDRRCSRLLIRGTWSSTRDTLILEHSSYSSDKITTVLSKYIITAERLVIANSANTNDVNWGDFIAIRKEQPLSL